MCKAQVGLDQVITLRRNGALVFAVCDGYAATHEILIRPTEAGLEVRGRSRHPVVVGGVTPWIDEISTDSCELFDATTRTWLDYTPLPIPLSGTIAVRLGGGKVLVAGGLDADAFFVDNSFVTDTDPGADHRWVPTGSLPFPGVWSHSPGDGGILLDDGTVLATFGNSIDLYITSYSFPGNFQSSEWSFIFTPSSGTWDVTRDRTASPRPVHGGRGARISKEYAGTTQSPLVEFWAVPKAAKLTVQSGRFTRADVGQPLVLDDGHAGNPNNGTFIIFKWISATEVLYWNAAAVEQTYWRGTWSAGGRRPETRRQSGRLKTNLVRLGDGRIGQFGGHARWGSNNFDDGEIYDPATGRWSTTSPMIAIHGNARSGAATAIDFDGTNFCTLTAPHGQFSEKAFLGWVTIEGTTHPGSSGTFQVSGVIDASHLIYFNPRGATETARSTWTLRDGEDPIFNDGATYHRGTAGVLSVVASFDVPLDYDPIGNFSNYPRGNMRFTVEHGAFTAADRNRLITISGAANPGNDEKVKWRRITAVVDSNTVEFYNANGVAERLPRGASWSVRAPGGPRGDMWTLPLPDGRVILVDGDSSFVPYDETAFTRRSCAIYDPAHDTWSTTGSTNGGHGGNNWQQSFLLRDGSGIVTTLGWGPERFSFSTLVDPGFNSICGNWNTTSEVYDFVSGTWSLAASVPNIPVDFVDGQSCKHVPPNGGNFTNVVVSATGRRSSPGVPTNSRRPSRSTRRSGRRCSTRRRAGTEADDGTRAGSATAGSVSADVIVGSQIDDRCAGRHAVAFHDAVGVSPES